MKLKVKRTFTDKTIKKLRAIGEEFEAEKQRGEELLKLGFVEEAKAKK